jgi:hypothetical protein
LAQWPTSATVWAAGTFNTLQGGTLPTAGPGTAPVLYWLGGECLTWNNPVTFSFQHRSETATLSTVHSGSFAMMELIS